jgi:hypothetical protein
VKKINFGKIEVMKYINKCKSIIGFGDLTLTFIIFLSFFGLIFLSLDFFKVSYIFVASLISLILFIFLFSIKLKKIKIIQRTFLLTILIFLIALLFRLEPSSWIMGGQDQGVYVNTAKLLHDNQSVKNKDNLRERFKAFDETQFYDDHNYVERNWERWPLGRTLWGRSFVTDKNKSEYQTMFMKLQPVWLSYFGSFLGVDNQVWALVFLGIISIYIFSMIIYRITGSLNYSLITSILLALSPNHVYFSKFPVSEMVTFFFFTLSILFIIRYFYVLRKYEQSDSPGFLQNENLFFSLSIFSLFVYFVSRATTFVFLPLVIILFYFAIFNSFKNKRINLKLSMLSVITLIGFLAALFFQFKTSYMYSFDIYRYVLEQMNFFSFKMFYVSIFIIFLSISIYLFIRQIMKKGTNILSFNIIRLIKVISCLALFLSIVGGLYRLYAYNFTDTLINNAWFNHAGEGIKYSSQVSLFAFAESLSYIGFILLIFSFVKFIRSNCAIRISLSVAFAFFSLYVFIFQWFTIHQFYYNRYFFSELYPLALIMISVYIYDLNNSRPIKKYFANFSFAIILLHSIFISAHQIGLNEGEDFNKTSKYLSSYIGDNDILLIDKKFGAHEALITPMYIWNERNIFTVINKDDLITYFNKMEKLKFDNIYYLTEDELDSELLSFKEKIIFDHRHMNFDTRSLPRKKQSWVWGLNLYKLKGSL